MALGFYCSPLEREPGLELRRMRLIYHWSVFMSGLRPRI